MSPAPLTMRCRRRSDAFILPSFRRRLPPVDNDTVINQPPAGSRVTVPEAAVALGVSVEAIRGRNKRGKLPHVKEGGTVYVLLPVEQTTTGRNQSSGQSGLVEELRDRVRRLEHDLDVRSEEIRRKDHIILSLSQSNAEQARTIRAIEATNEQPRHDAQDAGDASSRGDVPNEAQKPVQRPWWRRWMG